MARRRQTYFFYQPVINLSLDNSCDKPAEFFSIQGRVFPGAASILEVKFRGKKAPEIWWGFA
jgi:hypothetical protein